MNFVLIFLRYDIFDGVRTDMRAVTWHCRRETMRTKLAHCFLGPLFHFLHQRAVRARFRFLFGMNGGKCMRAATAAAVTAAAMSSILWSFWGIARVTAATFVRVSSSAARTTLTTERATGAAETARAARPRVRVARVVTAVTPVGESGNKISLNIFQNTKCRYVN